MSKKTFTIILITILLIALIGGGVAYYIKFGFNTNEVARKIGEYLPFGKNPGVDTATRPQTNTSTTTENLSGNTSPTEVSKSIIFRLSKMMVAGTAFVEDSYIKKEEVIKKGKITIVETTATTTMVRYTDKTTGQVYENRPDGAKENKLTLTLAPKIYESFFLNNGNNVLLRYLDEKNATIETYLATIKPQPKKILDLTASSTDKVNINGTTTPNEISGVFLLEDIKDISVSKTANSFFYYFLAKNGVVGTIYNAKTGKQGEIFSSPYTEWTSNYLNDDKISITTKASINADGLTFLLDTKTGKKEKLLSFKGLTTLASDDSKYIVFSSPEKDQSLFMLNTKTNDITKLPISTLPEKCVFSKNSKTLYCGVPLSMGGGEIPDLWYQGKTSFTDSFWSINTDTLSSQIIISPSEVRGGAQIDAIKLSLSKNEDYLLFVNKKDLTPWIIKIK